MVQNNDFSLRIQKWYKQNGRTLPWRETKSAYFIWLSEVILQQTRIAQGLSYYQKFVQLFPTVKSLAQASEQEILLAWQGLGYYSRARNLHKASKFVSNEMKGVFPNNYKALLQLPGIGKYTAAAIASFAYDLPHAVVDGNVYRLLSRVFNVDVAIDTSYGQKYFEALAQNLLDKHKAANHNQAIMEMGALICTPKQPKCESCPLNSMCLALKHKTITELPVKAKKVKVKQRFFHYFVVEQKGKILLQKRTKKDIWQNMYQFPLVELENARNINQEDLPENIILKNNALISSEKHVLTHQKILAKFYHATTNSEHHNDDCIWIETKDLVDYPLPRLIDRFLEKHSVETVLSVFN